MNYTSALCKLHRPLGSSCGFRYLFYSTKKKTKKKSLERCINVPFPKFHSKSKDVYASIVHSENVNMSVATKNKKQMKTGASFHSPLLVDEVLSHCLQK